ncbi:helix-turn-helix Psq domain family protein [Acanthocheilonema viteae]
MHPRRIAKRISAKSRTRGISKRLHGTAGFARFRQPEIPKNWKFETQKLRETIHTSVSHCHYDDQFRRERLRNAVFEALSGQKTMKGAATAHNVPFTTLQTYFHRSRVLMAKIMNDNDVPPEQIQIPVSLTFSSFDMGNALAENQSLIKSKKSERLNSLMDVLVAKVMKSDVRINESLPPRDFASQQLGSSKRKPKKVHRLMPASTTKNKSLEDFESSDWFSDQSQEMCNSFLKSDPAFAEFNICRVKQILEPDGILRKNKTDFKKANENKGHAVRLSSESQNYECLDKIEKCINDVCRFSHYPSLQREALHKAVAMVIHGEYSVTAAASIMQLPTSTVHSYVRRARIALVAFLQKTEILDNEIIADECILRSNPVSKEVALDISDLMNVSTHDLNGQQNLRDALFEVLTKGVPVTEVSSDIAHSAFQSYITKARVPLGQWPYPTSSNIGEISTDLDAKLPNDNADEENANKMFTNTEPLPGNTSAGFTLSAIAHPNITKDLLKHERQFGARNLLTKAGESTNNSPQTESSLNSSIFGLNSSSDQFDNGSYIQSNISKNRPRRRKKIVNMNATSPGEREWLTRNGSVLYTESGSDYSDDEFDGLPRSIRGVIKLLSDTKSNRRVQGYTGTPENLTVKIDKVLRQYRFRGDREKMRNAIFEVLYQSKTLSEASKMNNLAPTTLNTYVRLVKMLINTEKTKEECSIESAEKQELPMEPSSSAEDTKIYRELFVQNVDVMMLHTKPIINNAESFYKVLITYLIEQQYRRSEEAQRKMCANLEYVLLDGLSVTEALKVNKGPSEHVLQVYLSRCREVNKCIKTEFPNFKLSVAQAVNKGCANGKQDEVAHSDTSEVIKNSSMKHFSKQVQKESKESSTTGWTIGSLEHLNLIFSEDFYKALYDYLEKLNGVNFPIEDSLIVGLAKMIIDELPVNEQIFFADAVWGQWLTNYH